MYTIATTPKFDKQAKALAKKYPSLKNDLANIFQTIAENPLGGTHLGNDVYKIRMQIASKGKGKSGGARVIYFNLFTRIQDDNTVVCMFVYDKSEMENISTKDIDNALKDLL